MPDTDDYETVHRVALRRALVAGDPSLLHLHFAAAVLDRYREGAGFSVIRTDTVGRVRKQGGWSLDFGIAPQEDAIHVQATGLLLLPESEREHWAAHAITLPASRMFLAMRLTPGSCFDDGEVRTW
ncbi:MAG TPA: hypothetical protein VI789_01520 [Dehalococcoidia bacterium]|nr:hypothetical protein [Dehalococcoidia bacterium]